MPVTRAEDADFHYHRGNALLRHARVEEALKSFDIAISLNPNHFRAFHDRGNALRELNRLEDAAASYGRAISLKSDRAIPYYSRGFALQDLGRFDEALADYNRAIALRPDFSEALKARGTLELLLGQMRQGFTDFERRLQPGDESVPPKLRAIRYWQGEPLSGKSILVYNDEAFGDLVQFGRYLPLLAGRGATATLLAPRRFHKILETLFANVRVVSFEDQIGHADFRCEVMSLPFLFGTDPATIPPCAYESEPRASADSTPTKRPDSDIFRIGICWQGNPARNIDRGRSIPLAAFYPLSRIPGVRLISLQKMHGLDQLEKLPADMIVETLGPSFDSGADAFADTAALLPALDLVITSDTAMAHLAASLARPTWIALRFVPEWRWMLDRTDSPWYPTVRLFRQREPDRWEPVFEEIAHAVSEIARTNRG